MNLKFTLVAAALALTASAHAEFVLIDPQNVVSQVDEFLGNPSFEQAFAVGDVAHASVTECEDSDDAASCSTKTYVQQVTEVNDKNAHLSTDQAGIETNGEMDRAFYAEQRGSGLNIQLAMLRDSFNDDAPFAKAFAPLFRGAHRALRSDSKYTFEIVGSSDVTQQVKVSPDLTRILHVKRVDLRMTYEEGSRKFVINAAEGFAKDVPFVGQFAFFEKEGQRTMDLRAVQRQAN